MLFWVLVPCVSAHAQSVELRAAPAAPGQIRVDGDLGEWRGLRPVSLGSDPTSSVALRLAQDAKGLFVAAAVHDDAFVRSERPSPSEDALVVELNLPDGDGTRVSEVWLYAGDMGRTRAQMLLVEPPQRTARPLAGASQIIEGPLNDGYVIEAFIPWAALAGGSNFRFARARVRLHDVDHAGRAALEVSSSAQSAAARWPWLGAEGGPLAVLSKFLRDKNLGSTVPKLDWLGDVRGDARAERVLVVGTYLVLCDGEAGFTFADLPVTQAADVRSAELTDLTGDGKPELVIKLRQENELGVRELLQVFELGVEHPRSVFGLETRKQTAAGFVEAEVTIKAPRAGKAVEITTRIGRAQGQSAETYEESPAVGIESIVLPWGPMAERSYAWDGSRFALLRELPNPRVIAPATVAAARATPIAPTPTTVVHLEPPGSDALVAAYRQARAIPSGLAPRFVQHANFAEDARIESLLVFGAELVVVGDGFRGGTGFFYFGLPVHSGADVMRVFTGDVTGDGRRELFVRVRQMIGDVQREILLAYTFAGDSFVPLLSVEVRRAQGAESIGNIVALVREGRHFALQVAPGRAQGWSETTYPYVRDSADGNGPILLPWSDAKTRYRFDGKALTVTAPGL